MLRWKRVFILWLAVGFFFGSLWSGTSLFAQSTHSLRQALPDYLYSALQSFNLKLPKNSNVRFIPVTETVKVPTPSNDYSFGSVKGLEKISQNIQEIFPEPIQTAIYPLSGNDSGRLVKLFPNASIFLGIDENPFTSSPYHKGYGDKLQWWNRFQPRFNLTDLQMIAEPHMASKIIGWMNAALAPSFRLHGVLMVEEPSTDRIHGFIFFDRGSGRPIQVYAHINDILPTEENLENLWWLKLVKVTRGPVGVVVHAANGFFAEPAEGHKEVSSRVYFRNLLKRRGGVLAEGKRRINKGAQKFPPWEFSLYDELPGAACNQQLKQLWGYNRILRLTTFKVPKN